MTTDTPPSGGDGQSVAPVPSTPAPGESAADRDAQRAEARREVEETINAIRQDLQQGGLRWVSGTGYIGLWRHVHEAEEAYLQLAPLSTLIAEAKRDQLRLTGSGIGNKEELLGRLQDASADIKSGSEESARGVIRAVRSAINDFRDGARSGTVRARNRLAAVTFCTCILILIVTALAVTIAAPKASVEATVVYFLVGDIVACFGLLNTLANVDFAVEDYGLSNVRLAIRLLTSGLAAVGGVVIVAMLAPLATAVVSGPQSTAPAPSTTSVISPTPITTRATGFPGPAARVTVTHTPTPTSGSVPGTVTTPSLQDILNLQQHPFSFVIAAIFGLTPTLLLDRLLQQTEQYKTDIKSSQTADSSTKTSTGSQTPGT